MAIDAGRFVWFSHMSNALEDAQRYYTEVLPWKVEQMEMTDGSQYSMLKAGDAAVGGFAPLPKEGVPPHWASYMSVDDVDATAKKVVAAGGSTLMDAFDIAGVGRIQPVADPEGGAFLLFRSAEGDSDAASGPGAFHWNELWAKDPAKLVAFYEEAFGYVHDKMEMPNGAYYVLKNGDKARAGVMKTPVEQAPTMWQPYVEVDDCDAAVARAKGNGGTLAGELMTVPGVGRFAIVRDPLGAHLGLIKPEPAKAS